MSKSSHKDKSVPGKKKPSPQQDSSGDEIGMPSKRPRLDSNDKRRAGIITRMVLKNFMCHSQLEVKFDKNASIIIGRNGSGKSAILTALIIGLGGKAANTSRGSSIKGFIKAGKNGGSVEIEIYNGGPMAYRPSVYGSKIIVKRTFSASGGSSYRVESDSGQVIATNCREVQNITLCLNIQVDNPICILNQDTSRNFLNSNDPKHKFTLFMRATKLETLNEEYKTITNNWRESTRIYADKKKSFVLLVDELNQLKRKIEQVKSLSTLEHKVSEIQQELFWAKVRDAELEVEEKSGVVQHLIKKRDMLADKINNRNTQLNELKSKIQFLTEEKSNLKENLQLQSRPVMDVQRTLDELRRNLNEKRKQKQSLSVTLENKLKDAEMLQNEINSAEQNMSTAKQEKIERLRNTSNLESKIKDVTDHIHTIVNEVYQLKGDAARKEEEHQRMRNELSQIDRQIQNEKSSLNALRNESGDSLLIYGNDIPQVKKAIQQNAHKFKHPPKGPLGSYIRLRDKKWAVAAEGYLGGGLLAAFTVDNNKDSVQLSEIFKGVCRNGNQKPMIITSRFVTKKHDVGPNLVQAPHDCASLYHILEIEDPVVSNCIVDQMSIEGILLINDDARAIKLMSNGHEVPRNCKQSLTITGDTYFPDPNYKTYASRHKRAMYLQVDVKNRIEQIQSVLQSLQLEKTGIQEKMTAIQAEISEQRSGIRTFNDKLDKLNVLRINLQKELSDLKNTAEPEIANIHYLETELSEINKTVQTHEATIARFDQDFVEIEAAIEENEDKLKLFKNSTKSLDDRLLILDGEIREINIQVMEMSTSEPFDQTRMKSFLAQIAEASAAKDVKSDNLQRYTDQQAHYGERNQTKRNVQTIHDELTNVERSIRRLETQTEDVDKIQNSYLQLLEKHKVAEKLMGQLSQDLDELSLAIEKRKRHYKLTQDYFLTMIKHSFKKIMALRQFQGSIEVNMTDKKLDLVVIPQQGSQGLTTTSNLSGGERSFSTVAFLYSLWQCMDFPFYFLDEFDVYMDKLNRTKVIDILLDHAWNHSHLQYVFLTPQDVSFINRDVSILRLEDPKRIIN